MGGHETRVLAEIAGRPSPLAVHMSGAMDHIAGSLKAATDLLTTDTNLLRHVVQDTSRPTDMLLAGGTIALAFVTFFVAIVPIFLDVRSSRRNTAGARRQMAAILDLVRSRILLLEERPAYRAAVLLEGIDAFLLRSLQSDIGAALSKSELSRVYAALNEAAETIADASHRQAAFANFPAGGDPLREQLRDESEAEIKTRAAAAARGLADAATAVDSDGAPIRATSHSNRTNEGPNGQ